jgi:hypothetical protein
MTPPPPFLSAKPLFPLFSPGQARLPKRSKASSFESRLLSFLEGMVARGEHRTTGVKKTMRMAREKLDIKDMPVRHAANALNCLH